MSMRVVSLRFQDGHPVCAPIFVSLEGRNYQPTDIEFEEEALRSALRDGLVRSRSEVFAVVAEKMDGAMERPIGGRSIAL
jgi:hypothetical protein